jgi:cell division protein FtsB
LSLRVACAICCLISSSFLNSFIKEVSDLLDGLEKRQNALERENAELKKELDLAKALIEEGNKAKDELIEKLSKAQQQH